MSTPYYHDAKGMTLYHGDCLDILPTLPDASFDAIITDPPYGVTNCAWDSVIPFDAMWRELKRLIRPRGAIVLFGSQPFTSALIMSNVRWFKYSWVWDKGRGFNPQLANMQPMKAHEDIVVFAQEGHNYRPQKIPLSNLDIRRPKSGSPNRRNGSGHRILSGSPLLTGARVFVDRFPESILFCPAVAQTLRIHDTQKPLALMEYLVKTYTNEGDMILDFTAGSGTTLRAAKNLGRKAVGIELLSAYCAATVNRLAPRFEEAMSAPDGVDWTGTLFEEVADASH